MGELLSHLWPQFSAIGTGGIPSISAFIVALMLGIIAISIFFIFRHWFHFYRRFIGIQKLIQGRTKENLAAERREMMEKAFQIKPVDVGLLWREFDESLVASPDQKYLYNTLDAEHFFNSRNLAKGLTGSRLLAAAPSFLVAIGVLGTFVGLTVGLDQLNVESSDIDVLKVGIDQMISSAAVAFMTSVWGVGLSLFLNLIEKILESRVLRRVTRLQQDIDFLYPRVSAEQSLVHISESTEASKDALLELHERIGSKLQETVTGITANMQEALTDTLNQVMKPAIQALVDNTNQQSTEALESLIKNFMSGVSKAGEQQGQQLQNAASQVNEAVNRIGSEVSALSSSFVEQQKALSAANEERQQKIDEQHQRSLAVSNEQQKAMEEQFNQLLKNLSSSLSEQFNTVRSHDEQRQQQFADQVAAMNDNHNSMIVNFEHLLKEIAKQSEESAQQHLKLLGELKETTSHLSKGATYLDSSANQLGILSGNLKNATDTLSGTLNKAADQLVELSGQNEKLSRMVTERMDALRVIQESMNECAAKLESSSTLINSGFNNLGKTQDEFLNNVREQFNRLGESLQSQVSSIEKQANEWLNTYANEVNQQVNHRMEEWNNQTLKFANQMLSTVQAISNVVDELEDKK